MIVYAPDLLERLKQAGWNRYRLTRAGILSGTQLANIRRRLANPNCNAPMLSLPTIGHLCDCLGCQPGDILRNIPEKGEKNNDSR